MRKTIIGALPATIMTFSGAGLAHATTPAADSNAPAAAEVHVQDDNTDHDGDKTGFWGLLGLTELKRRDTLNRPTTPPYPRPIERTPTADRSATENLAFTAEPDTPNFLSIDTQKTLGRRERSSAGTPCHRPEEAHTRVQLPTTHLR